MSETSDHQTAVRLSQEDGDGQQRDKHTPGVVGLDEVEPMSCVEFRMQNEFRSLSRIWSRLYDGILMLQKSKGSCW